MAYSQAMTLRERSAGIAGVAAVHAGLGALIVLGLAATIVVDPMPEEDPFEATNIWSPPPPPPKDKDIEPDKSLPKTVEPEVKDPKIPPITVPPSPFTPPDTGPQIGTIDPAFPDIGSVDLGGIGIGGGTGEGPLSKPLPTPEPTPTFAFDPVKAAPSNNASRWVTDSDYKSSWIRREMAGVARFSLGVGTNGRVTDCRVTSSTGYDALDNATCRLIAKRARFTPAKDGNGKAVEGSYSSSIRWNLPE